MKSSYLRQGRTHLLGLGGSVGLGPEVGRGGATGEEAAQHRLEEGVEDDLGTAVRALVGDPRRRVRS